MLVELKDTRGRKKPYNLQNSGSTTKNYQSQDVGGAKFEKF